MNVFFAQIFLLVETGLKHAMKSILMMSHFIFKVVRVVTVFFL